jgi:hypothetical protein
MKDERLPAYVIVRHSAATFAAQELASNGTAWRPGVGDDHMPDELPFEPIKLNSPPGASPPFPSVIRSIQDAKFAWA